MGLRAARPRVRVACADCERQLAGLPVAEPCACGSLRRTVLIQLAGETLHFSVDRVLKRDHPGRKGWLRRLGQRALLLDT